MSISQPPFQSTLVDANDRVQTPWAQWFSQLQPILQSVVASGPTSGRPTQNLYIGYPYFDTTIDQMVYWNGVIWVTYAPSTTGISILKGNGSGGFDNAVAGVDFAPATSGNAILYGNGSGGFSSVAIGSGVTFAGGVLSASGSGGTVTAVTGTAPIASSGGTTPAISISQAGASTNGYLSSTDWNTFNSKAPATSGASILYGDGTGGFSNVTIGSGVTFVAGTLSATGSGGTVTSVTGTAPITSSGGTAPAISISQAGTATDGYLSSIDWNTFNNKGSGTVTAVTGSGNIASSGGTTPNITFTGTLPIANGGTNGTATPTAGAVAVGNGTQYAFTAAGLAGQVLTSNGSTVPTWATVATGVTSITGTANQVIASASTGAVTLSLPQSINSGASPTFLGSNFTGIPNAGLTNSSITINASSVSLGGSTTVTATATNALTIGTGLSGTSYNGSTAVTIANTGVLSFSGNSTGLTPATATTGAVSLAGVLVASNGGTGVAGTLTGLLYGNGTSAQSVATTAQALALLGTIPATSGGTGFNTTAVGDLIYGSATNTWSKLSAVATGNVLLSGGITTAPSWGKVALASAVSGTLPVANGGTGLTTLTYGYIPWGNGTSALNSNSGLYYDGSNLGIGATSLGKPLVVSRSDTANTIGSSSAAAHIINTDTAAFGRIVELVLGLVGQATVHGIAAISAQYNNYNGSYGGNLIFSTNPGTGSGVSQRMQISAAGGVSIGNTIDPGAANLSVSGTINTKGYTVATLPTVGTVGRRAYVTDALTPTFGATVVGGGAVVIPVFDNGTSWVVG